MTIYLLYTVDLDKDEPEYLLGGGSSTPAQPRVYDTYKKALKYAKYFDAIIKEIEL